jgi:tRNA(Ile)-lysidine synthase
VTATEGDDDVRIPPPQFDVLWLGQRLRQLLGPLRRQRLCLAYSGGLDSTVLLHALAGLRARQRFALRALHVNHQLQAGSQAWAEQAAARAGALGVTCERLRIRIPRLRGRSLEAAAREARYAAIARELEPDELLLTAHHQEDQLETLLLALMRGSGVRGLAGMSALTAWHETLLVRPLLQVGRAQLERYARARALQWTEDPSNEDLAFDRNYLRRRVLPLLTARWSAAAATAGRSAAHLAEARTLLEQLAMADLVGCRDGAALRASALRTLPLPRRRNALRQWLGERGLQAPGQRRLQEIAVAMLHAKADAQPRVRWDGAAVRRHADQLYAQAETPIVEQVQDAAWDWRAQPWLPLRGGGAIGLIPERHGDVRLAALPQQLQIRYRRGGERLRGVHGRSALKDLLQSQHLAPWERAAVPLILHQERIIAVADLWLDHEYRAADAPVAERGRFRWRRNDIGVSRRGRGLRLSRRA